MSSLLFFVGQTCGSQRLKCEALVPAYFLYRAVGAAVPLTRLGLVSTVPRVYSILAECRRSSPSDIVAACTIW